VYCSVLQVCAVCFACNIANDSCKFLDQQVQTCVMCFIVCCSLFQHVPECSSVLNCALQCFVVCCSVLPRGTGCMGYIVSVLQCLALCGSAFECVWSVS